MTGAKESIRPPARILIVDDEEDLRWVLKGLFRKEGYEVREAGDGEEGFQAAMDWPPDLVITDIRMPRCDGLELLERLRERRPSLPAVVLTAVDQVDTAVSAMKGGASDYVVKPFDNSRLLSVVRDLLEGAGRRSSSLPLIRGGLPALGVSKAARSLAEDAARVAATELSVLIQGESGTGKEYLARAIHALSPRREGPFTAVDCGALPPSLAESLLFGHKKGSFTGAERDRKGIFLEAHGGTLFLDEIGNLPAQIQAKLLRALQEKTVIPLGESNPRPFDARVLCASNLDLSLAAREGRFRLDLFHRINGFTLRIPPLRERPIDIRWFAGLFLLEERGRTARWTRKAMEALLERKWPGNLRELRNTVARALLLSGGGTIQAEHVRGGEPLEGPLPGGTPTFPRDASLTDRVREAAEKLEREWILQALDQAKGNKAEAARILKVDYTTLHRKLKRLGLD